MTQRHESDFGALVLGIIDLQRDVEQALRLVAKVGTTEGYTKWHIYADFGDVLELDVSWSCGNPFYYAYGFDIAVKPARRANSDAFDEKRMDMEAFKGACA